MKNIVLLFLLLNSLWGAKIDEFADKNNYFRDYNTALTQKTDKIIMLVLVADFCPWCKKFERKVLENKDVSKIVKQNFVPVIVDNYRDIKHYPKAFSTHQLPTIYFIDSKTKKVLNKSSLYMKKDEFISTMKETIK